MQEVTINGKTFVVTGVEIPGKAGKWACIIKRVGGGSVVMSEPDAVNPHGAIVEFDTPQEAEQAGHNYLVQDFLRDPD